MRNPWRMQDGPDNKINRNNFPMSFQYNGTFKYGKIYPIGLIRTIPGASYQIDSTLALNFMPTAFPIQTRQRAYVHFFYGRDRNFWKDYKDFVNGMNPELVKPYIDESVTKARTGNLLDYLGVPTTIVGSYGDVQQSTILNTIPYGCRFLNLQQYSGFSDLIGVSFLRGAANNILYNSKVEDVFFYNPEFLLNKTLEYSDSIAADLDNGTYSESLAMVTPFEGVSITDNISSVAFDLRLYSFTNEFIDDFLNNPITDEGWAPLPATDNKRINYIKLLVCDTSNKVIKFISPSTLMNGRLKFELDSLPKGTYNLVLLYPARAQVRKTSELVFGNRAFGPCVYDDSTNAWNYNETPQSEYQSYIVPTQLVLMGQSHQVTDIDETTSPYWRSGATTDLRSRIKLSAIPCRMYETIYNLYYRNPQNNPYILNGKPEYNVFIPTKDGGPDNNLYELRYRNWEDDFLTTAVQTPQQGIAPLVGLTDRGATVTLTNEDGSVTRYKTNLDENGNVTGIETTDSSEPLLTQALIDAVSYGISIEDLRNVNAMQKWLELNLRKGYQYKDIIEARWGISISYNELDLPEFIGGFTQEVGLQAVTQTTSHGEGIEGALGWQAGRMYAAGSGRSITHYCEEEGYIMALLTIVPVPNYSQLLPKHWFTRDLLDSYQPEFNHIGFQPITYKEVCPIQAYQESTENVDVLEQTFGYQRPWYEYFNQVDEVHGQFRTTFKDFLINRTFNVKPELSESFLLVDPEQVNDVFAVQTDDDKIIGAINHRITAKLPISLYAQARLE